MKVNKKQYIKAKEEVAKTLDKSNKIRLKNQNIIVDFLNYFTGKGIAVNLTLMHMPLVNKYQQFTFEMNADDFLDLYNGEEVMENRLGLISRVIYEQTDEISTVKLYAATLVRPRNFDSRKVLLSATVLDGK